MQLSEFPQAIQSAAKYLNELEDQLADRRQDMTLIEIGIDVLVAGDANLKNDQQRKSARATHLIQHKQYQNLSNRSLELQRNIADAKAELECLRNQFSVAKLELRLAIADKLAGVEARDLVGV